MEKIEKAVITDAVKWEADPNYSRETVTVANGVTLKTLQVVGQTTATGKYKGLDVDASTGSQAAAGIALADVDATAGDTAGVILNGDALVDMEELVWPDDITDAEKSTAIGQLRVLGIKTCNGA